MTKSAVFFVQCDIVMLIKYQPSQLYKHSYPDNCAPRKIARWLGLVLGLGGNQTIGLKENFPPVRVRVWVRVSFGVWGQFSSGAIVLEPSYRNDKILFKAQSLSLMRSINNKTEEIIKDVILHTLTCQNRKVKKYGKPLKLHK